MTRLGTDLIEMRILGKSCKAVEMENSPVYNRFMGSVPLLIRHWIRVVLPVNLLNNPTALGGEVKNKY